MAQLKPPAMSAFAPLLGGYCCKRAAEACDQRILSARMGRERIVLRADAGCAGRRAEARRQLPCNVP
jgi:hypothetical protein